MSKIKKNNRYNITILQKRLTAQAVIFTFLPWFCGGWRGPTHVRGRAHRLQNLNDGTCPAYFQDICCPVASVDAHAGLWSADRGDLIELRTQGRRCGPRSFRISAPAIWNNLPVQLRAKNISQEQFADLKAHLFARAYALEHPST